MKLDKIDCFYTIKYKGAYIHCKSVNNVEVYTVQIFDGKNSFYTKECRTMIGSKRFISKQGDIK